MPKTGQAEAAAERRPKALDLRIAGARYRQIGAQLGVSYQTAYRDVQTALGELAPLQAGKAEKLRELELERCDKMQLGLWPKVRLGDEKAVRALVAVMDRRAKLLGLVRMASLALTPRLPQLTEVASTVSRRRPAAAAESTCPDAPTKLKHGGADGQPLVFTLNISKPTHDV